MLNYCGTAWQPWLAATNVVKLDACQNRALRLVTGQLRSTPLEALRAEAEVTSMHTTIRRNCAVAWEKSMRLPASNPRARLTADVTHRLKTKGSWRKMAREEEKVTGLGVLPRLPRPPAAPPWGIQKLKRWSTRADIGPEGSRGADTQILKTAALQSMTRQGPFEWTIYTDGTPGGDGHDSGAAAVVTRGPPDAPELGDVRRRRGGRWHRHMRRRWRD